MSEERKTVNVGFMGLLALIFITLKLTGFIDWSWWYVTAPLWGGVVLILVIYLITIIGGLGIVWFINRKNRKE